MASTLIQQPYHHEVVPREASPSAEETRAAGREEGHVLKSEFGSHD